MARVGIDEHVVDLPARRPAHRREAEGHVGLAAAQRATAAAQERLSGYIGSLYRTGMGNSQLSLYSSLLDSRNPQQLFKGLSMAQRVGGNTNNAFVALSEAEIAQAAAAERSAAAERQQREAEEQQRVVGLHQPGLLEDRAELDGAGVAVEQRDAVEEEGGGEGAEQEVLHGRLARGRGLRVGHRR